ncbi:MAG: VOC family protein, partial [Solirubrobacteraceae bacterium]
TTAPQTAATPALSFADPEGLALELAVVETDDPPLVAVADGIPAEHALQGFDGVRAYAAEHEREEHLLTGPLGFRMTEPGVYEVAGARHAVYTRDEAPAAPGAQGAGTVHHVAWCDRDDEHTAWRRRVSVAGARPTQVIDRQYFLSIYFREPGGVLFELATPSPGFAIDEDPDHLGEQLRLPPQYEPRRERLERSLIPLVNPRTRA